MRNLLLKFLSTLSLEVSLSASILSFILAQLLNVFVPPLYYIILSLSVLTIYSLDHALDAKNTPPENLQQAPPPPQYSLFSSPRIRILSGILTGLLTLSAVIGAWIALPEYRAILIGGALLSLIVILYFCLLIYLEHYYYVLKELSVAGIFTLGIAVAPLIVHYSFHRPYTLGLLSPSVLLGLVFFALLMHNALIFSYVSSPKDARAKKNSIVLKLGPERSTWVINAWGFLTLLGALVLLQNYQSFYKYYLITAIVIQGMLFKNIEKLRHSKHFHRIGDGYFILLFIACYAAIKIFQI